MSKKKTETTSQPRLRKVYEEVIKPRMLKDMSYSNVMQIPKIEKVVVNTCVKDAAFNQSSIEVAFNELFLITGQKPVITKAAQSIAGFKIRAGMSLGCKATLRGDVMYEFIDRLVNIALPRVRDFKGFSKKQFDGRGNLSIGLKEQLVFPEINYDKVDKIRGMNITFVTTAKNDAEARLLFELFDIPFFQ